MRLHWLGRQDVSNGDQGFAGLRPWCTGCAGGLLVAAALLSAMFVISLPGGDVTAVLVLACLSSGAVAGFLAGALMVGYLQRSLHDRDGGFPVQPCGHPGRYKYNRGFDPGKPQRGEKDFPEDWGCYACDLPKLRRELNRPGAGRSG